VAAVSVLDAVWRFARECRRYVTFRFGASRGVYGTFAEARRHIRFRRIGFDHAEVADEYARTFHAERDSSDYPVLFHLLRGIGPGAVIVDFGGNVGARYLRYRSYLEPLGVRWIVWDVPAITAQGRRVCAQVPEVVFIENISELRVPRVDALIAVSSMQYVEAPDAPRPQLVGRGLSPRLVIFDQIPVYDGPPFVTVQNAGITRYPQRVFNRREMVEAMRELGYTLADTWDYELDSCLIPFHRERSFQRHTGVCFVDGVGVG
jgi:putative methyltransferase (TIGR04325 family)